jgi:hypothetical protein
MYPDRSAAPAEIAGQDNKLGDYPIIIPLDSLDTSHRKKRDAKLEQSELDFASTLGTGSLAFISTWARECVASHKKCLKIFPSNDIGQSAGAWFPDRLIHITRTKLDQTMDTITARIVLKSDSSDFPPDKSAAGINYLSLSHC